jgi:Mrp family chromosome partitioning ATPase
LPNDKTASLLSALRSTADYVIVQAPPTPKSADAQTLAALVDATVVVVEPKVASYDQVLDAVHQLDGVGSEILGAVVAPTVRWKHAPKEPVTRHESPRTGVSASTRPTVESAGQGERSRSDSETPAIATSPSPES